MPDAQALTPDPPLAPTVALRHGAQMPQIGLGTWPLDDDAAAAAVAQALRLGYRSIDTAFNYRNEVGVGRGLRESGIPRDEVFLTTKLNAEDHGYEETQAAFRRSAEKLGVEYLDLFLIHWPNPQQDRYVDAYHGLLKLLEDGHVRAIGTSNFLPHHLDRVQEATGVPPDVDQIQLAPNHVRAELRAYLDRHGIVTTAWTPIGKGGKLLRHPTIARIAEAHGRTPAQVVLRWHVQQGGVAIPKSADAGRQRENLDVFGFRLAPSEMDALFALDEGEADLTHPDRFGH